MLVCPAAAMETAQVTVLSTICSTVAKSAGSSAPQAQGHSLLAGVLAEGLPVPSGEAAQRFTQLTSTGHPGSRGSKRYQKREGILLRHHGGCVTACLSKPVKCPE